MVGLARRARELEDTAADYASALECDRGDLLAYADLQERIATREKELSRDRASADRDRARATLRSLHRGDVLALPGGKRRGYAVVLDVDREVLGGPQLEVLDTEGRRRTLRPSDVPSAPAVIDTLRLPKADRLGSAKVRKDTAAALREKLSGRSDARSEVRRNAPRAPSTAATDQALQALKAELAAHPCASCPDLESHLRWVGRWRSTRKELASVQRRIEGRTSSLGREFDRLCALLVELGYLEGEGEELHPTERGLRLRRLFSDRDLMIAECLDHGAWEGLDSPGLAAVVSAAVYESRREDPASPDAVADPAVQAALAASARISADLSAAQARHQLETTPPPDPSLASIVQRWARGEHLAAVLVDADLPPGDFVRHCRQVIDLLDQLTADPELGPTAREAIAGVRRGLVAQEIDR